MYIFPFNLWMNKKNNTRVFQAVKGARNIKVSVLQHNTKAPVIVSYECVF